MRWLLSLCLVVVACDRGPEVPTAVESRELDEAGTMLDNATDNLEGVDAGELEEANQAQ